MRTFCSVRAAIAAVASAATLILGTGVATAATVQTTIDFGMGEPEFNRFNSFYTEKGFEFRGISVSFPFEADGLTRYVSFGARDRLTVTRTGGGDFSLVTFDESCPGITGGGGQRSFAPIEPHRLLVTRTENSVTFAKQGVRGDFCALDNIVLSYENGAPNPIPDEITPVPLPAALPLLLAGIGGMGLVARRKARAV